MALGNAETYQIKYVTTGSEKSLVGLNSSLSPKSSGGIFSKQYGIHLIKSNLIDLLTTKKGDRVMLPQYGTNVHLAVFEPLDEFLKRDIQNEILMAIATYEPRVDVLNLTVQETETTEEYSLLLANAKPGLALSTESKITVSLTVALKGDVLATENISLAF